MYPDRVNRRGVFSSARGMFSSACGMFSSARDVFPLLLFTVCLMKCWADEDYGREDFLKREYSLMKPYQGLGSSSSSHWDLLGTAMITTEHVRLTPDSPSRQGAVWSRIPCFLRHWELQVHFKIHGHGKKNLNGDGLAVWFTKERMQIGPVFGNINLFTGLGVFLDTYPNDNKHHERVFPYLSAMVGNGSVKYDHDRDGRTSELGGCNAILRNVDHDTFISVRYAQQRLTIMTNIDGKQEWRACLDRPGVHLPLGYYFGASAITGDLSDNHDLISLKLYQLTVPLSDQEEEEYSAPSVDHVVVRSVEVEDEGMSGVTLFFFILLSLLGCFLLGVVCIILYSRWKESRRKRFY